MFLKALTVQCNGCFVVYRFEGLVATGLRHGENFELSRHHPGWVLQELEVWLHLFFLLFLLLFFLLFALLHLLCQMQHRWVNVPLNQPLRRNWPIFQTISPGFISSTKWHLYFKQISHHLLWRLGLYQSSEHQHLGVIDLQADLEQSF